MGRKGPRGIPPFRRGLGGAVLADMAPPRGIRVLLIEDNRDVRDLTWLLLERLGVSVTVANDGAEGYAAMLRACPDLVLCDLVMPIMDGIEFAQHVRRSPACGGARLVALTSRRDDDTYLRACAAGFDAYLEKPLTKEKFESVAARFLDRPSAPPS